MSIKSVSLLMFLSVLMALKQECKNSSGEQCRDSKAANEYW